MRRNYNSLELKVLKIKDDIVRTSDAFISDSAPDVYAFDPFMEN